MKSAGKIIKKDPYLLIIICCELLFLLFLLVKIFSGKAMEVSFKGDAFFDNIRSYETISEDGTDVVISRMPAEQQADLEHGINIYSGKFALRSGGYMMTVDYSSKGGGTIEYLLTSNGYLGLRSTLKDGSAVFDPLYLDDAHTQASGRLYIPVFSSVDDLQLFIHYDGPGELRVNSITITERRVYRAMQFLGFLICFVLFDLICYFLFSKLYSESGIKLFAKGKQRTIFIAVLTVFFSSLPLFIGYIYKGHDILFHLNRIEAIASAMRYHKLPVRIQSDLLLGFGYNIPLYYCDIFLYPGAFFYEYCMLPLRSCYQGYVLAMNILTAYLSYRCFRTVFRDRDLAAFGMAMYTLSAYRLIDVYLRAAAGEYTALAFIPLVVEGTYRIYTAERIRMKDWLPLAVGMSCLIQSHIVTTIIVGFFLFLFVLIMIRKLTAARAAAFVMAAVSSLLMSIWFLLPMLESMKTQKPVVTDISSRIQWTGIYLTQIFELFPKGSGISREGTYGDMPLGLGAGLLAAVILLIVYSLLRNVDKDRDDSAVNSKVLNISFGLGMLALWMSTVYFPRDLISRLLIGRLDSLRSVWEVMELVWRHMTVAVMLLIMAFTALLVIIRERRKELLLPVTVIVMLLTIVSDISFYQGVISENEQVSYIQMDNDKQAYLDMSADYDMVWGMTREIMDTSVICQGEDMEVSSYSEIGADRLMDVANNGPDGRAVVPLFDYGNYHAYDVEGGTELATERSDVNARLAVEIPPGYKGRIRITYESPMRWRIAEAVSALMWAGLALSGIIGYVRERDKTEVD